MTYRVVILSRGRAKTISSHFWFPGATLVVPDSQVEAYAHCGLATVAIPDAVHGIAAVRNWIQGRFTEDYIVQCDDDVMALYALTSTFARRLTPADGAICIQSTAQCAHDAGLSVFGWSSAWDVRHFDPTKPFSLVGWVGSVWGLGRGVRCDERLTVKGDDVDAAMRALAKERVIWRDNRFSWAVARDNNPGGLQSLRTAELVAAQVRYLAQKWSPHLRLTTTTTQKTKVRVSIRVKRRQV